MEKASTLSERDKFHLSKFFPGQYDPYAFIADTNAYCPSKSFSIGKSLTNAFDIDAGSPQPIGTKKYLILMYVPSISPFSTDWVNSTTSARIFKQLSGFVIAQTDNLSATLSESNFRDDNFTVSFDALYETGSNFGARKFVWAGHAHFDIVTPSANLVGAMYSGTLPMNSFLRTTTTVGNLVSIAQNTHTQKGDFSLVSSMTNDILGSATLPKINTTTVQNATLREGYSYIGAEKISYVVLQSASQSITDTTNRTYSLIGDIHGNFGFYPEASDAFLYNMFRISPYYFGTSRLVDVPYMPLVTPVQPPASKQEVALFIKELPMFTSEEMTNVQGMAAHPSVLEPLVELSKDRTSLGFTHFSNIPDAVRLSEFLQHLDIDTEILLEEAKRRDKEPLKFSGALISSGLRFAASTALPILKQLRDDQVGRDTVSRVIGKKLTGYIYGKGTEPKQAALTNIAKLLSSASNTERLKNPKPKKPKRPKLDTVKGSRQKRPRSAGRS
jgi:hypothetical protein